MHFQTGHMNKESRANKLIKLSMLSKDVADILAQKTFDAFSEFLDPVHILLRDTPAAIFTIRRSRPKLADPFLHFVIPGNIGDQILQMGKGSQRLDDDRSVRRQRIQTGHTGQTRMAVYFCGTRAATARLAVPAYGQGGVLSGLNLMKSIQHDHPLRYFDRIVLEFSLPSRSTPYAKSKIGH